MKKRLTACMLAFFMILLVGCSSNTAKEAAKNETKTETSFPAGNTETQSQEETSTEQESTAIDEAIAHSTNLKSLDYALTQMGYEHCLSESREYWTIVPKGYKKPIRLKNLGEDYTEEAIKRRLTENQGVRLMPFTNQTVVIRQYRLPTREHKIKKVGGLYGLYLHYEMTESQDCPFVLWIGSRRMIKRKVFDEFIERQYSI